MALDVKTRLNKAKVKLAAYGKAFKKKFTSQSSLDYALGEAAKKGKVDKITRLLADGANPKADFNVYDGETALGYAVEGGHAKAVEILMAAGADANVQMDYGSTTPLTLAVSKGDIECVKALVAGGADINYRQKSTGQTPLAAAVRAGNSEMAVLLQDLGANIDAVDRYNNGPLAYAVWGGRKDIVTMLLERNARTDVINREMKSLLDIAHEAGRPEIYGIIRDHMDAKTEPWQVQSETEIAHVSIKRKLGYRLTEIFNFQTKQFKSITYNYESRKDQVVIKAFSDIADKEAITLAQTKLNEDLKIRTAQLQIASAP